MHSAHVYVSLHLPACHEKNDYHYRVVTTSVEAAQTDQQHLEVASS